MRILWLAVGLAAAMPFALLGACGSDTVVEQTTGSGGTAAGGGGSGGNASSSSSSSSSGISSSSSSSGTAGCYGQQFDSLCDEACCYIGECTGFENACDMIPGNMFNCGDPAAECPAGCALDTLGDDLENPDCSSFTFPLPEGLQNCIAACGDGGAGSCTQCLLMSCSAQAGACQQDTDCSTFLQCAYSCTDTACVQACYSANPSQLAQDVIDCTCVNCTGSCPCGNGTGGAGGAGGGGGAGGT